jgi:hypothetical protein
MPLSKIPAVGVDATGTPSATTYFRGDNTWATVSGGVGDGQTWQNVAASRAAGTTYTNTTGRPIALGITFFVSNSQDWSLTIGGVIVSSATRNSTSQTGNLPVAAAIVPSGATYVVTVTGATIQYWAELR